NRGVMLVDSPDERLQFAELNLIAGRRARSTTAYESALVYLAVAESLLSEEHWQQHYALRFSLALHRAECEFLTGKLATADERLAKLQERAIGATHLAAVTSARITVYITMNRTDRAIEVGLEQLRAFGIDWSAHPGDEEVRAEYDRLRTALEEH